MELKDVYQLIKEWKESYTSMWRKLGISDNGVRKRLKSAGYELPKKKKWLREYECKECKAKFIDDVSREKDSRTWIQFCNRECMYSYARKNKKFNSRK